MYTHTVYFEDVTYPRFTRPSAVQWDCKTDYQLLGRGIVTNDGGGSGVGFRASGEDPCCDRTRPGSRILPVI